MHPNGHTATALGQISTDMPSNGDQDPTDGIWMTKAQLAAVRRISVASADRLIRRQGWRKHPGNDGRARVLVPRIWAEPRHGRPTDVPHSEPPDQYRPPTDTPAADPTDTQPNPTDKTFVISVLQAAVEAQSKRADRAEAEAESQAERATIAEEQREQVLNDLRLEREQRTAEAARLQATLDQAFTDFRAERSRAETLREQLEVIQAQLATAEAEAKAAHDRAWVSGEQQSAAEQRAEADRARADRVEAQAAHEREDFLDAEARTRRELETVVERVAQAEAHQDRLRAEVDSARAELAEARRTEDARKGRGRWARLRAAWRGE
jgi:colicin import membrane protein